MTIDIVGFLTGKPDLTKANYTPCPGGVQPYTAEQQKDHDADVVLCQTEQTKKLALLAATAGILFMAPGWWKATAAATALGFFMVGGFYPDCGRLAREEARHAGNCGV